MVMLKDLLVNVPTTQPAQPVITYATSLAAKLGAHLDAIAFGYEPINAELSFEGAAAVAAVMEMQRERALKEADAALTLFETAAKAAGIASAGRKVTAIPAEAAETIGTLARLYDLTIVAQPDGGNSALFNVVPEAVLFNSGRPMLMVPYIQERGFRAAGIMICWDGKRAAARAVLDAMPLLGQAEAVDIIAINEDSDANEAPAAALATHLGRQGITAKAERLTAERGEIAHTILSAAADRRAELIVMGGYGHSRLREFVLGGATRGLLQSMTVPVLMSH
jgi:nucleotide-binding universal stress UspA family protein